MAPSFISKSFIPKSCLRTSSLCLGSIPTPSCSKGLRQIGFMLLTGAASMVAQTALAAPTGYNQITYHVDATELVKNDEVTASLSKQAQAATPKLLAIELNTAINQALQIAKRYPTVTASTGSQSTYPRQNNDDGKILGWTGSTSLNLKSNDFNAMSELIASLQDTLVMQDLRFGISKEKRDDVEQELVIKASKAFKEQADVLTKAWDSSGYQVVSVTLDTHGGYNVYPMQMARAVAVSASMESAPSQNFEGGDSEVKVSANGTIELIPYR